MADVIGLGTFVFCIFLGVSALARFRYFPHALMRGGLVGLGWALGYYLFEDKIDWWESILIGFLVAWQFAEGGSWALKKVQAYE